MGQKDNKKGSTTPYDDALRVELEKMPRVMIPLINEAFNKQYDPGTTLVQFKNEHMMFGRKAITDSHLYVGEITVENHHYHFECESSGKEISIRMAEYDLMIALEGIKETSEGIHQILLPSSAVLYLRYPASIQEYSILRLTNARGESLDHWIRNIRVTDYTEEEIIQKKLYALFPFYFFRYEKIFCKMEIDEELREKTLGEYLKVIEAMEKGIKELSDSSITFAILLELAGKVSVSLLKKHKKTKERMKEIMGGNLIKLKTIEMYEAGKAEGMAAGKAAGKAEGMAAGKAEGKAEGIAEGKAEGIAEGRAEGVIETLYSLVKDKILSLKDAANRAGLSEAAFMEQASKICKE